jgi:hypothetical protein
VGPFPRERVVHREADAVHPLWHFIARKCRERKCERVDEALALVHQRFAFLDRLARDEELTLTQVAQAAVDELCRPARRARGKILRFDEQRFLSVARGFAKNAGARNATANHDDVPRFGGSVRSLQPFPHTFTVTARPHGPGTLAGKLRVGANRERGASIVASGDDKWLGCRVRATCYDRT